MSEDIPFDNPSPHTKDPCQGCKPCQACPYRWDTTAPDYCGIWCQRCDYCSTHDYCYALEGDQ